MRIGSVIPPPGLPPTCAQVYVLDPQAQVAARKRLSWGGELREALLREIAIMLRDVNPFVHSVMKASEEQDPKFVMYLEAQSDHAKQRRRYNRPTVKEVAIFLPEVDARRRMEERPRDLFVRIRGRHPKLMTISDLHPWASEVIFLTFF